MAKKPEAGDRLIDAALKLAAERGWRDATLPEIARAAGVSLAEAYRVMPSRSAVLDGFARRIEAELLGADPVEEESIRLRHRNWRTNNSMTSNSTTRRRRAPMRSRTCSARW